MDKASSRARRVGWWGIALISVVAACGTPQEGDSPPTGTASPQPTGTASPPIDVRPLDDPAAVDQPLNAFVMTRRELQEMFAAEVRLRVDCVARFGLRWDPPEVDLDVPDTFRLGADTYVRYDEARAQQYGYHAAPGEREPAAPPRRAVDPQVRELLTGAGGGTVGGQAIPADGCVGEARRILREGIRPGWDENYPSLLAIGLQPEIERDERVVAEFAEWSACMKAAGFDYGRPRDAWDDPAWRVDEPTVAEKAVAVAEVRCGRETALAETVAAVERAHQERVVQQRAQDLADYQAGKETVLRRVATVLDR